MKTVIFSGPDAVEHPGCGVLIVPGENVFSDDVADRLVSYGVVSAMVPTPAPEAPAVVTPVAETPSAPNVDSADAPGSATVDETAATRGSRKEAKK